MTHPHKCQCGERRTPQSGATTKALVLSCPLESDSSFWHSSCFSSICSSCCHGWGIRSHRFILYVAWWYVSNSCVCVKTERGGDRYILTRLETDASVNIEMCFAALSHTRDPFTSNQTGAMFLVCVNAWKRRSITPTGCEQETQSPSPPERYREEDIVAESSSFFLWCNIGKSVLHLNQGPKWQTLDRAHKRDRQLL